MFSPKLTKLRILQERAQRKLRSAEKVRDEAQLVWEKLWLAYLDEAEASGLCRFCLKPINEGKHDGSDHIGLAA